MPSNAAMQELEHTPKFVSKKVATAFFTVMTVTVLDAMHNWMKLSNQCAT
jgi:hypothetical protein